MTNDRQQVLEFVDQWIDERVAAGDSHSEAIGRLRFKQNDTRLLWIAAVAQERLTKGRAVRQTPVS